MNSDKEAPQKERKPLSIKVLNGILTTLSEHHAPETRVLLIAGGEEYEAVCVMSEDYRPNDAECCIVIHAGKKSGRGDRKSVLPRSMGHPSQTEA